MEFWIKLFEVISSLVVAGIVAYIAYRQFILDRNKFKFDLYDRRLHSFKTVKKILMRTVGDGDFPVEEDVLMEEFWETMAESDFIFGKEVSKYLEEIYKKGVDLHFLERRLRSNGFSNQEMQNQSNCFEWFRQQFWRHIKKYSENI